MARRYAPWLALLVAALAFCAYLTACASVLDATASPGPGPVFTAGPLTATVGAATGPVCGAEDEMGCVRLQLHYGQGRAPEAGWYSCVDEVGRVAYGDRWRQEPPEAVVDGSLVVDDPITC